MRIIWFYPVHGYRPRFDRLDTILSSIGWGHIHRIDMDVEQVEHQVGSCSMEDNSFL